METIDQQVINDNKDIYARIQSELFKAESEILLATAWFTDEDLFNILSTKLDEGVSVEVIIADNQENEKLDFGLLASKGASVYKIKNSGYGIMNQKFCVIDQRIALHGSYNWSINAKKNNQESIISTNHQETIRSLIENFNEIKIGIVEHNADPVNKSNSPAPKAAKPKGITIDAPVKAGLEFEQLLDSMIAAESSNFDRKLLREYGFGRCNASNGDHQVLDKAFDTLYSVFINDIDVVEDKKNRLIAKIEEFRVKSQDTTAKNYETQIDFLEREHMINKSNLEVSRTNLEAEIEVITKTAQGIKEQKIPVIEQKNEELEQQIRAKEREFVKPVFKWFEFVPTVIFALALFFYLFIFYSSAAYILLFSIEDTKVLQAQGISFNAAQIFDPKAVTKAWNKEGAAPYFIFLFTFIPLAFAVADRFVKVRWATLVSILSFVFGIFVLDGVIAYKVTEAVHEVNYMQGNTNNPWHATMAFTDTNFYMVFMFGAAALILFKLAFKKLLCFFEDRNPDTLALRNELAIKQIREEKNSNGEKIITLKEEVAAFEKNIIQLKADIKRTDLELADLPKSLNQHLQKRKSQLVSESEMIDRIAAIYTTRVQSDNIPVSIDALKDRINIFLEGWNDFLFQEYATPRASLKTSQAAQVATDWQANKLSTSKIGKQVKFNQDA
jgi:hypothetical protein